LIASILAVAGFTRTVGGLLVKKFRITTIALLSAALSVTAGVAPGAPAAASHFPDTIDLPDPANFAGEGVATGRGNTFYAGSRLDGRVARGDLRAGTSEIFIAEPIVSAATGLKADLRHDLLWVAGAATGQAAVYDLETGDAVVALTLTTSASFINDVVVTRDAAYFTDSVSPVIYRVPVSDDGDVGDPQTIQLLGPAADDHVPGQFNLNGIEATGDGRTLIAVNSNRGTLYTIDAATGASATIDLGGASTPTGDGILLVGNTLLVLQNGAGTGENQVAVVKLRHHRTTGEIVDTITNPLFETATTLARRGSILVAVNAQFVPPPIDAAPEVVLFELH
jgi:hypothetical protein